MRQSERVAPQARPRDRGVLRVVLGKGRTAFCKRKTHQWVCEFLGRVVHGYDLGGIGWSWTCLVWLVWGLCVLWLVVYSSLVGWCGGGLACGSWLLVPLVVVLSCGVRFLVLVVWVMVDLTPPCMVNLLCVRFFVSFGTGVVYSGSLVFSLVLMVGNYGL